MLKHDSQSIVPWKQKKINYPKKSQQHRDDPDPSQQQQHDKSLVEFIRRQKSDQMKKEHQKNTFISNQAQVSFRKIEKPLENQELLKYQRSGWIQFAFRDGEKQSTIQ